MPVPKKNIVFRSGKIIIPVVVVISLACLCMVWWIYARKVASMDAELNKMRLEDSTMIKRGIKE